MQPALGCLICWRGRTARCRSNSTSPDWIHFAEGCTPRQLALFGFPPPGHPIWTEALIEATQRFYPKLDLDPWRSALTS